MRMQKHAFILTKLRKEQCLPFVLGGLGGLGGDVTGVGKPLVVSRDPSADR